METENQGACNLKAVVESSCLELVPGTQTKNRPFPQSKQENPVGVAGVVGRHREMCAFLFSILLGEWTALSLLQDRVFCKGPAWHAGGTGIRDISG